MDIEFDQEITQNLRAAESHEWLVTNGIGGYASGTVAGPLTRRYHGLLVAALSPPLGRTVLLAKLDETVYMGEEPYALYSDRLTAGLINPLGYANTNSFRLDRTIPVWRYAIGEGHIEKRIWMQNRFNTTYISYQTFEVSVPVTLKIKAFVSNRDFHALSHSPRSNGIEETKETVHEMEKGLRINPKDLSPYYILCQKAAVAPAQEWFEEFDLPVEAYRGQDHIQDLLYVGYFRATIEPGETLTIVASTEGDAELDGTKALDQRRQYEQELLDSGNAHAESMPAWVKQLSLAADQFVVDRASANDLAGKSIIAGYHWFGDWGRDTMISLPGLTLSTGRPEIARSILHTYAHHVDNGMIPNRFPDYGQIPEYNTVDATLWYFQAIDAYFEATGDTQLLVELFPTLTHIVYWHQLGTRFRIRVDPEDGLLFAGEPGVQLSWMDAKVGEWVVTPRIGKAIEINALWYNALLAMVKFADHLRQPNYKYRLAAEKVLVGFQRFWNEDTGYCFDVIDGPEGNDDSLRPNQIFAVSLPESPLSSQQQRAVVEICGEHLLTPFGMRSLAPDDLNYQGQYGGNIYQRDGAYHQGTVWGWLLGPYCLAHLRVFQDTEKALSLLQPLIDHLSTAGMGTLSEIFDGDEPFTPRGSIAQAWTVAEVLRAHEQIQKPHK